MTAQRVVQRIQLELKIKKTALHPVLMCRLVQEVLDKKYKKPYEVKRGYLNMDAFGKPVCFTYFWLENSQGNQIDVLKIPDNEIEYFFTEHMPAGSECINKDMDETEDLWDSKKWDEDNSSTRSYILKKHPNNNICTVGGSA